MASRSSAARIRAAASMPASVVAFKVKQEFRLRAMQAARSWERLDRTIIGTLTESRARMVLEGPPVLFAPDGSEALRAAAAAGLCDLAPVREVAARARRGQHHVFGHAVPQSGDGPWDLPWHEDWRFRHRWAPAYFKSYNVYAPRERSQPFDVKFPWEVSRLRFLLHAIVGDVIAEEAMAGGREYVAGTLASWQDANPLAYSVAWQPMEASVRALNLAIVFEMLRMLSRQRPSAVDGPLTAALVQSLARHGEFVARTREFGDVRGNHYAANIAALAFVGALLRDVHPPARRWFALAVEELPREIECQFHPDGGNIEQSVAYHRLVTMCFLVSAVALERCGVDLPAVTRERLRVASLYSIRVVRPDGSHPSIGDSDDATILGWGLESPTSPTPLNALAATYFGDLPKDGPSVPLEVPLVLGHAGVAVWKSLPSQGVVRAHLPHLGAVIVRDSHDYLFVDVGEVGLRGRGGHGHNDISSFELWASGEPLIMDPGSYIYTGDQDARDLFRSSAYHNLLTVDDTEIAPLRSLWRIDDSARPQLVEVSLDADVHIEVEHHGYHRLPDPVTVRRRFGYALASGSLDILDAVTCREPHVVTRAFHLAPGVTAQRTAPEVLALERAGHCVAELRFDGGDEVATATTWRSSVYGQRTEAMTVTARRQITGASNLRASIRLVRS